MNKVFLESYVLYNQDVTNTINLNNLYNEAEFDDLKLTKRSKWVEY